MRARMVSSDTNERAVKMLAGSREWPVPESEKIEQGWQSQREANANKTSSERLTAEERDDRRKSRL